MLKSTYDRLKHNPDVITAFRDNWLFVCPYRHCVLPTYTPRFQPEIDVNLWEIDETGQRVLYVRDEKEKNDPLREAIFSK